MTGAAMAAAGSATSSLVIAPAPPAGGGGTDPGGGGGTPPPDPGGGGGTMTVAVSPGDTHGFWDAEVHQGICDPVSAIPIGGVLPITYAWEWVSGAVFSITPTTIAKDVTFTFTGATPRAGVYKVTATDKNGLKAQGTVNVYANQ